MKNTSISLAIFSVFGLISCSENGPQKIAQGNQCDNCRMTIEQLKYGAELVTSKGRVYKFDDISCLDSYVTSNPDKAENGKKYVTDYPSGNLIDYEKATFIKGGTIKSPMGGNTQAYLDKAQAEKGKTEFGAN